MDKDPDVSKATERSQERLRWAKLQVEVEWGVLVKMYGLKLSERVKSPV